METPRFEAFVPSFWLDAYAVSVARFAAFVAATGHTSTAEAEGGSLLPCMALPPGAAAARGSACDDAGREAPGAGGVVAAAPWWVHVPGAAWHAPEGPGSALLGVQSAEEELALQGCIHAKGVRSTPQCTALLGAADGGVQAAGRAHQPVVHVSPLDAAAFCEWAGGRLPTEEEWEAAARGGMAGQVYPWGGDWPRQPRRANTWQGAFPHSAAAADGFRFVAPISAYGPQNAWGVFNMVGNVWEWTSSAWGRRAGGTWAPGAGSQAVKKGGSFLCHRRRCFRYRNAARSYNTVDTSAYNVGFRCAYEQQAPPAAE